MSLMRTAVHQRVSEGHVSMPGEAAGHHGLRLLEAFPECRRHVRAVSIGRDEKHLGVRQASTERTRVRGTEDGAHRRLSRRPHRGALNDAAMVHALVAGRWDGEAGHPDDSGCAGQHCRPGKRSPTHPLPARPSAWCARQRRPNAWPVWAAPLRRHTSSGSGAARLRWTRGCCRGRGTCSILTVRSAHGSAIPG
jgi:hypothetical protein